MDSSNIQPKELTVFLKQAVNNIERRTRKDGENFITTGFTDLDRRIMTLNRGDLILVTSRPAMGKTTFLLSMMAHLVRQKKFPIYIFSMEYPGHILCERLLSIIGEVEYHSLRTGNLTEQDWKKLADAEQELSDMPIFINDNSKIDIGQISQHLESVIKKYESLSMVFVLDGMKQFECDEKPRREEKSEKYTKKLKELAQQFDVPIVFDCQISRKVENRKIKKPYLFDTFPSSQLGEIADTVFCLYRESYYHPDTAMDNLTECRILKNKNGNNCVVFLSFDHNLHKFNERNYFNTE